jgi:hypothetical protein
VTATGRDYLEATRPLIEATIGRRLRHAEHVVDVFALTAALDAAKDLVEQAVAREQARAIRAHVRTQHPIRLEVTRAILRPLEALYVLGVAEAYAELSRAGYNTARALEAAKPKHDRLDPLTVNLESQLNGFSTKLTVEADRVRVQLETTHHGAVGEALANALLKVLGARSIAASVVSTALFTGMGTTFEENQAIIGGWEISAVLDGGTCDECESHDGETFDSWDEIQELLPNGGPAVYCLGGDRCRCRAVPQAAP